MIFKDTMLAALEQSQKTRLLQAGRLISLRRQSAVEEETLHSWLLVVSGILRVETTCAMQPAACGFLKKSDFTFFGRDVMSPGARGGFTVRAVLDSNILAIPADVVHDMMLCNSRLATALMYDTLDRAHRLYRNVAQITSTNDTEVAIRRTLFELSTPRDDGRHVVDRRISQREIAESLGLSREQVNKVMRVMETRGLVHKDDTGYSLGDEMSPSVLAPLSSPDQAYEAMRRAWSESRKKEAAELRAGRQAETA